MGSKGSLQQLMDCVSHPGWNLLSFLDTIIIF
jgi:hypothetical protein